MKEKIFLDEVGSIYCTCSFLKNLVYNDNGDSYEYCKKFKMRLTDGDCSKCEIRLDPKQNLLMNKKLYFEEKTYYLTESEKSRLTDMLIFQDFEDFNQFIYVTDSAIDVIMSNKIRDISSRVFKSTSGEWKYCKASCVLTMPSGFRITMPWSQFSSHIIDNDADLLVNAKTDIQYLLKYIKELEEKLNEQTI